jgi:hypothetical protein
MKTFYQDAACSAVTGSFGVIAAIVALSARPFIPRIQDSLFHVRCLVVVLLK